MNDGNSTIVRVYLMLYCPLGTLAEEGLKTFCMDMEDEEKSSLECDKFHGKGSSFHPPFFAFEVGFKQLDYDYDQLISNIENLFNSINKNIKKISDILLLSGMRTIFVINFNC